MRDGLGFSVLQITSCCINILHLEAIAIGIDFEPFRALNKTLIKGSISV